MLAVTFFEKTISVFKTTDENNSFPKFTPGFSSTANAEETLNELEYLSDRRSEKDRDLHINEVNKGGNIIVLDGQEYTYYNLLDKSKYDYVEMLKKNKYDVIEDMFYRLELTKNKTI